MAGSNRFTARRSIVKKIIFLFLLGFTWSLSANNQRISTRGVECSDCINGTQVCVVESGEERGMIVASYLRECN